MVGLKLHYSEYTVSAYMMYWRVLSPIIGGLPGILLNCFMSLATVEVYSFGYT